QPVLADYQSVPTPPGSYETLTESSQVRVDLFQNLLGIYARVNVSANNAPSDLNVQDVTSYVFGSDLTWKWLRLGAEYQIYHSSESDYRTLRLLQSASLHPDEASTLGIELGESFIDYVSADRTEQDYHLIVRYHRSLTYRLALDFDGGVAQRQGNGVNET